MNLLRSTHSRIPTTPSSSSNARCFLKSTCNGPQLSKCVASTSLESIKCTSLSFSPSIYMQNQIRTFIFSKKKSEDNQSGGQHKFNWENEPPESVDEFLKPALNLKSFIKWSVGSLSFIGILCGFKYLQYDTIMKLEDQDLSDLSPEERTLAYRMATMMLMLGSGSSADFIKKHRTLDVIKEGALYDDVALLGLEAISKNKSFIPLIFENMPWEQLTDYEKVAQNRNRAFPLANALYSLSNYGEFAPQLANDHVLALLQEFMMEDRDVYSQNAALMVARNLSRNPDVRERLIELLSAVRHVAVVTGSKNTVEIAAETMHNILQERQSNLSRNVQNRLKSAIHDCGFEADELEFLERDVKPDKSDYAENTPGNSGSSVARQFKSELLNPKELGKNIVLTSLGGLLWGSLRWTIAARRQGGIKDWNRIFRILKVRAPATALGAVIVQLIFGALGETQEHFLPGYGMDSINENISGQLAYTAVETALITSFMFGALTLTPYCIIPGLSYPAYQYLTGQDPTKAYFPAEKQEPVHKM